MFNPGNDRFYLRYIASIGDLSLRKKLQGDITVILENRDSAKIRLMGLGISALDRGNLNRDEILKQIQTAALDSKNSLQSMAMVIYAILIYRFDEIINHSDKLNLTASLCRNALKIDQYNNGALMVLIELLYSNLVQPIPEDFEDKVIPAGKYHQTATLLRRILDCNPANDGAITLLAGMILKGKVEPKATDYMDGVVPTGSKTWQAAVLFIQAIHANKDNPKALHSLRDIITNPDLTREQKLNLRKFMRPLVWQQSNKIEILGKRNFDEFINSKGNSSDLEEELDSETESADESENDKCRLG